jgi:hypothetical protein
MEINFSGMALEDKFNKTIVAIIEIFNRLRVEKIYQLKAVFIPIHIISSQISFWIKYSAVSKDIANIAWNLPYPNSCGGSFRNLKLHSQIFYCFLKGEISIKTVSYPSE